VGSIEKKFLSFSKLPKFFNNLKSPSMWIFNLRVKINPIQLFYLSPLCDHKG
jgi:hypothetical protein